jgi:hypothetical protein
MANNRNRVIDLIGILLALAIGISGTIFELNPIGTSAPGVPMLSTQDWPGSLVMTPLRDVSGTDISQWQERRIFNLDLHSGGYSSPGAKIGQQASWFADTQQASVEWKQHDSMQGQTYSADPLRAKVPTGGNLLTANLYCKEPSGIWLDCVYIAQRGHWFTAVWFESWDDRYLSLAVVQRMTARVDQLLMSAPDRP